MAEKRKRSQNFTFEEKEKLIKLLAGYKHTILSKKTDGSTNKAKNEAWNKLSVRFNSTANVPRSKESLMRVWEKMKYEAKSYKKRITNGETGTAESTSGSQDPRSDIILEQVSAVMDLGGTDISDVTTDSDGDILEEHTESITVEPLCESYNDMNESNGTIENLKIQLLEEELLFKRELYQLQLETARKELEIKTEMFNRLRGVNFNVQD